MSKSFTGVVSSDVADKTIVVSVQTRKTHPIYKKQYTVSKKFMAHDEANDAKIGDTVLITETTPLSKRKRFALTKVVERAAIRHTESDEAEERAKAHIAAKKAEAEVKATSTKENKA